MPEREDGRGKRVRARNLVDTSASWIRDRDGGHQRFGVGMACIFEHRWPRTYFDETPQIHNPNVVRYALDDRNIVTDEEEGQSQIRLQFCEKVQHLRLYRDIQCRDRLVGYDQARMGRDCAGDRNALPLSSGQFVRVAVEETAREIDAIEELPHAIDDL